MSAPDIVAVVADNNPGRLVSIGVLFRNRVCLGPNEAFFLFIDSDQDSRTGRAPAGLEFRIAYSPTLPVTSSGNNVQSVVIEHSTGSGFEPVGTAIAACSGPGALVVSFDGAALGIGVGFNFAVQAVRKDSLEGDQAPDALPLYEYRLAQPSHLPPPALVEPRAPSVGGGGGLISRPTDPKSVYAYDPGIVVHHFSGRSAVVYYVTGKKQVDAPAKLDKNGNGVPDYVEAVAKTADGALAYYRSPRICFPERHACESTSLRGFKRPRLDRGGLNGLPDIYLKAGLAGDGTTISSSDGVGGAFIVLSPHLSLKSIRPREGLTITLAHELFHLVQDAYVPRELPLWIAEGTANAAAAVYATAAAVAGRLRSEDSEDLAVTDQFDLWNQKPWLPLYSGFFDCSRCYGNLLWWVRIFVRQRNLVEHFFERLSTTPAKKLGVGVSALDATFRKFGAFSERSLADAFSAFSIERFLQSRVGTLTPLQLAARGVETVVSPSSAGGGNGVPPPGRLNGFSTHFIPLLVPPEAAGVEVVVESPTGADPLVDLFAGSGTFLQGRRLDRRAAPADAAAGDFMGQPGLRQTVRFDFRDATEKHEVILVLSSRISTATQYRLRIVWT